MTDETKELVLVTGGSGFVAAYCIIQCLSAGYRVRTTVRSTKREKDVLEMLKTGEATNLDKLTFAVADLVKDDGWKEAVQGCTYVLHVASPFPPRPPKHEDDLIVPAREGTLRVLRAARDAGVKRVVLTSSVAAVEYGHPEREKPFTEEDWTIVESPLVKAYGKSKTLAERAAWNFIEKEGGSLELTAINPAGIFGPVLGTDFASSIILVQRMLNGEMPGCPQISLGVVDVRDVADLHIRAMTSPKASGERFICSTMPTMTLLDMSLALRERLGTAARRSPTRKVPNLVLKAVALFDPSVALILPQLGKIRNLSNEKATRMLDWHPRSKEDALVATAESLMKFGLIKKS